MERYYETTIVYDAALSDSAIEAELEKVASLIASHNGSLTKKVVAGKHKLAYTIKHKDYGIYALLIHTGDPTVVSALERALLINENVLRQLVVKKDKFSPDGELVFLDEYAPASDEDDVVGGEVAAEIGDELDANI